MHANSSADHVRADHFRWPSYESLLRPSQLRSWGRKPQARSAASAPSALPGEARLSATQQPVSFSSVLEEQRSTVDRRSAQCSRPQQFREEAAYRDASAWPHGLMIGLTRQTCRRPAGDGEGSVADLAGVGLRRVACAAHFFTESNRAALITSGDGFLSLSTTSPLARQNVFSLLADILVA